MTSSAIVKELDVFENRLPRLGVRRVITVMHQLRFERSKEAFGRRVIPTIAFAAHAAQQPVLTQ